MTSIFDSVHPLSGPVGNFFARGDEGGSYAEDHNSWREFLAVDQVSPMDPYLNLLYRWDIYHDPENGNYLLLLHFVQQTKGAFYLAQIDVSQADEPSIRQWLSDRAKIMVDTWSPLLDRAEPLL